METFPGASDDSKMALVELLRRLGSQGYAFVTPTPRTHEIVMARADRARAKDLPDVFGWSLPFRAGALDSQIEALLADARLLTGPPAERRAMIRVSSLRSRLFAHSSFPTTAHDAVFFGPDSYRFADLVAEQLVPCPCASPVIVDIGTGAGVGALVAAQCWPQATIVMTDINPAALGLARANAEAAGVQVESYLGDIFGGYRGRVDMALANPPYILDAQRRLYRDGGALHGAELSIRMIATVLPRLHPGGRFILYTGSAIVGGQDRLRVAAANGARVHGCSLEYREIDPDVFGEELLSDAYADVDRIAAIAAVFHREASE